MLLTKRKAAQSRLLCALKAQRRSVPPAEAGDALLREKELAVVDAVEWAAERWASRDWSEPNATDPRAVHAARLIAALRYLDSRFERLDPAWVTEVIDSVTRAPAAAQTGPRLDSKAAAALLTVEVGAFGR